MIKITDITDFIVINCPKCNNAQLLNQWGKRKCHYEKCDGELNIEYNTDTAKKLLEIAIAELKHYRSQNRYSQFVSPIIQRYPDGSFSAIQS